MRRDSLPAPSFPAARANPLNQMKDTGFVQSLDSGGKRFVLLAGSNRRKSRFRERASLVVKVQPNRACIGPFVGVAEEICLGQSASGPIRPAQNDGVRVTTQNRSTGRANTYPTPRSVWMICGALGSCSSLRRGGEFWTSILQSKTSSWTRVACRRCSRLSRQTNAHLGAGAGPGIAKMEGAGKLSNKIALITGGKCGLHRPAAGNLSLSTIS